MEDTAATLAAELDRLLAMARELEARVDGDQGAPGDARQLCAALAESVDRAIRLAGRSPPGGEGEGEGNATGRSSVTGQVRGGRKSAADKVRTQVRVASVTDVGPLNDGLSWRKYGQKDILGATYPRAYFRCTHRHTQGCRATKQVQRAHADPLLFDVLYLGAHTCAQAAAVLASLEHQPPAAFGLEQQQQQSSSPEGIQWPVESLTPPSFPSSPAGCYTPGNPWCQLAGSHGYADMAYEYDPQFDELLLNLSEVFQPEVQNL
ncbi:transcription factor WRKY19-like [Hordeum vulgare subsp. vulgare]|uniref:WRKY domain-containing protein n=2 Tax=Hordeum vulgare TaxID=4513 RepID=A0A8I6X7C3_HORVV|nr:transcription factor WRKY19-like [Hordeum vulgare subsp. vulgare]